LQEHPAKAWVPRHFTISPSGKWLVVAAQKGNKLVVHKRDPDSGMLTSTDNVVELDMPMWITFPQ